MGKHDVINHGQVCNGAKRSNVNLTSKFSVLLTAVYVAIGQEENGSAEQQIGAWEIVAKYAKALLSHAGGHGRIHKQGDKCVNLKAGDVLIYPFAWKRTANLHSVVAHKYRPAVVVSSNHDGQLALCPISTAHVFDMQFVGIPDHEAQAVGLDVTGSSIVIAEGNIDNLSNLANLRVNYLLGRFSPAFTAYYQKKFWEANGAQKVRVLNRFDEAAAAQFFTRGFHNLAMRKIEGDSRLDEGVEMPIFSTANLNDARLKKLCHVAQYLMRKLTT